MRDQFDPLQSHHREALERDVRAVCAIADVDRANATLWVADGEGSLVRWASHDRIYTAADYLRRIEMGHDSRWVAGRAISEATVIALDAHEQAGTSRRWNTVVAVAIFLEVSGGPAYAGAVLSVGLPDRLAAYEARLRDLGELLTELAGDWALRLTSVDG